MGSSSPKLPLTDEEKANLRSCKVKLSGIAGMELSELADYLGSARERAEYIRGLVQFQSVPSIGPRVAQRVTDLGNYSLEAIAGEDGAELTDRLERQIGFREDPCLEDAFRCIVHYANHPESGRSWFDFTAERRRFREQYGYPDSRPDLNWTERER